LVETLAADSRGERGAALEHDRRLHRRGVASVLLAGGIWSLSGLFIRHLEAASHWQIIFYRSAGLVAVLLGVLTVRHRGAVPRVFVRAGLPALVAGVSLATAFVGFIVSITHTTVANTLFLLAASPLLAAGIGRAVLGERVLRATWIAMAAAALGIALMVTNGLARGTLVGNLMGLVCALGSAVFAVALRSGRSADMLPAVCVAGVFSVVAAVAMLDTFVISFHDLAICLALGGVQMSLGMTLYTAGSRHVPAAELTLLSMSEVALGPLWVWLGFGEVPSALTLAGGGIILAALAGQALSGGRRAAPA